MLYSACRAFDREGHPYAVTGRPFPEALGATLQGSMSRRPDPVAVAADSLGLPFACRQVQVEQVALPVDGAFIACWQVRLKDDAMGWRTCENPSRSRVVTPAKSIR